MTKPYKIGLVGGRGFVGGELIKIIEAHEQFELEFVSSSSKARQTVPGTRLKFLSISPQDISKFTQLDALVLALPNGEAHKWVTVVDQAGLDLCILDISADYRFDTDWVYGLTELHKNILAGAKRIANPGCYATAAQLALFPIRHLLSGAPSIFGVSGYSGAGATPNPRNNPDHLKDNFLPYALSEHIHEREISRHLGQKVHFSPHVASFFRGISLTIHMDFKTKTNAQELTEILREFYQNEPLVLVGNSIPEVQQTVLTPKTRIGGATVDESGLHGVLVVSLDNLLKGAASQAIQNLELAILPSIPV